MNKALQFIQNWGLILIPVLLLGAFWLVVTFTNILY